ncbi:hypothetical protein ACRALDRAFT_1059909 [Sodiomyces alcalophilus JCM 7366]|uniref:uncharacterized protein n=1 Tax=Sodiomyces alcalophilus JCM 7366 TaxID=591952 RepID=UPI0039B69207
MSTYTRTRPPTPPTEHHRRLSMGCRTDGSASDSSTHASIDSARNRIALASPPLTPVLGSPDDLSSVRLRSSSGLTLHTNDDALRQYTDYNSDGTPRTPIFAPVQWGSINGPASGRARRHSNATTVDRPPNCADPEPRLPVPDFFSRDMLHAALADPHTFHRLFQFAQKQGCEGDVEFLMRVQCYAHSLEQFIDQAVLVPKPTGLPFHVSRSLTSDMRHMMASVIPGLENLFTESAQHVEQRVQRHLWPAFVKNQLAACVTSALLNHGPRQNDFPGLGSSFCLSEAAPDDDPIKFASDGFFSLTGYNRTEIAGQNGSILQGPQTDSGSTMRIRNAVAQGEEAVELLLNYRRDSWPFWNYLHLFPLADQHGTVQFYLGAQINVSETVGDDDDVLRILGHSSDQEGEKDQDAPMRRRQSNARDGGGGDSTTTTTTTTTRADGRRASLGANNTNVSTNGRRSSTRSATRSFFKPFKKPSISTASISGPIPESPPPTSSSSSSTTATTAAAWDPENPSPYTRHLVLKNVRPARPRTPSSSSNMHRHGTKSACRLEVAFASPPALSALGLDHMPPDAVAGKDIFTVLADYAHSPSVTKAFRSTIMERVLEEGKQASADLVLGKTSASASASASTFSRYKASLALSQSREDVREIGRERRPSRPLSRSGMSGLVGEMGFAERLVGFWTPLKDVEGSVEWVVLILLPV